MFESKTKQILEQTLKRSRNSAWCHEEDCLEGEGESHEIITEKRRSVLWVDPEGGISYIKEVLQGFGKDRNFLKYKQKLANHVAYDSNTYALPHHSRPSLDNQTSMLERIQFCTNKILKFKI